jgi:predicted dehydrogenase
MEKIKVGIIGMGYIGVSHIEALRRIGFVELAAVADTNYALAKKKADEFHIPKCYATMEELIADPEINAIHNCTPNNLHLEVNTAVIKGGKHIYSEKPLAMDSRESGLMIDLLSKQPDLVAGVNFNYRMYPLIQDAKIRIASGEIGRPYLVHGCYLQDWLLFETDYNWRLEPEYAGASRCVGDIGTHWMDLAQVMVGSRITEVCANTLIAMPKRKKPTTAVESFAVNTSAEYKDYEVKTEDYAGALIRFENGATGVFQCSQISAGRKCFIDIEVDGENASFHWNHEIGDRMWKGNRNSNNEEIMRNPNLMKEPARPYSYLAAGHPEGWNDAFKNGIEAFYRFIRDNKKHGKDQCDFATFQEGHYLMKLIEAVIKSGKEQRWVKVDEI